MKAVVLERTEKIGVKEIPRPAPALGEVLIRVKACGICMKARGLTDTEFIEGIEKTTMNGLVEMCVEADNVFFS